MLKKYCRFSDGQLRSLGLNPTQTPIEYHEPEPTVVTVDMISAARGNFGQILDILYSSKDGDLDNNLKSFVSENAPIEVRQFVNNVLLLPHTAFKSAPDDDTAFDMIIPRNAQTPKELMPYLDAIRGEVSEARERYLNSLNNTNKSD